MPTKKKENAGCGCASIPFSVILLFLGLSYWGFRQLDDLKVVERLPEGISQYFPPQLQPKSPPEISNQPPAIPDVTAALPSPAAPPSPSPVASNPPPSTGSGQASPSPSPSPSSSQQSPSPASQSPQTPWEQKQIRGIYLSRYQATNNASEQMIRDRVRYYKAQGLNTVIHGVWGNGCTMYASEVMQQTFGQESCPNQFQDQWLDWLIDEAHKQGMQVHAYFEKGIKLDENSPIFDTAIANRWIVPGVDKTYPDVDHYLLDVEVPEVEAFFKQALVEFVQKYPEIDAVQWDDYLGYHEELPGKVNRTQQLTAFVKRLKADMKAANPSVSFDLCHHNPYWGKRYFAADWDNWGVDRAFIQIYNDDNFDEEIAYAEQYEGVAITEQQLHRVEALVNNPKIKSILVFPAAGNPEEAAKLVKETVGR
ncbi:MAG: family 10 glycosylhydrolase [Cyanobacteria bacterium P01_G01_bin.38]